MQRQRRRSERLRVTVLIGLLGFLLLVVLALRLLPGIVRHDLQPQLNAAFPAISLLTLAFLVYEVSILLWLKRQIRLDAPTPPAFPYLNTLVEMSLPTLVILAGSWFIGGLPMLAGSVPFVYFLFLSLTALNLNPRLCLFAGVVAGLQFLVISFLLVQREAVQPGGLEAFPLILRSPHQYIVKGMLLVASGCITAFVASQIRRQLMSALQTLQERDRAVSIFGQHVSPQVAELLLRQPVDLQGEERSVCVMFLDIRDFSRIAGERSPAEVMEYLNTLFSFMIPLINDHHGIINKFLGDGFMAVFGAPVADTGLCRNAVDASMAILRRVDEMNAAQLIPPTRLGIGLHLGVAITGNVGGGDRKEYTVIGDVVNLAARIEQATKTFQAQLLVSEEVAHSLGAHHGEDLGLVELKGQAKPARLFKLA